LKPARRHYKLNDDVIKKVRFLAEYGAPLEHIAPAAGVSYPLIWQSLKNAKGPNPTPEELKLLEAIEAGRAAGGMRLISKVAEQADEGDFKAATWMLTHSPAFRDHYSDNAAVNRARQEGIEAALQAVAESGLPPDQERIVVLRIAAKTGHNVALS
jgi:hypothetical protein